MRIGIDFDNTIAGYDRLFARLAVETGLAAIPPEGGKRAVRAAAWDSVDGDLAWQRLQALAYGPRLAEAEPIAGVREFLSECRSRGVPVFVVSHKTRFAAADRSGVDLHQAALAWLDGQGFLAAGAGDLDPAGIHFETTRAAKIARIHSLGLSHFIDDLEEVLADPAFPRTVEAILFDPSGAAAAEGAAFRFRHWHEIGDHVFQRRH